MAKDSNEPHYCRLVVPPGSPLHFRAAEMRGNNTKIWAALNTEPPGADSEQVCKWEPVVGVLEGEVPTPLEFGNRPRLSLHYHIDSMPGGSGQFAAECWFTSEAWESDDEPSDAGEDCVTPAVDGKAFRVTGSFTDRAVILDVEVALVEGEGS